MSPSESAEPTTVPPSVDGILASWRRELGDDFDGYRNHVHRVVRFALALRGCTPEERDLVVLAACFHDLGIWTAGTFDYLPPSVALARRYLERVGRAADAPLVVEMIERHHQLRRHCDARQPLVEVFRRADLVDLSLGRVRFGLPRHEVAAVRAAFANAGFHRTLLRLTARRWLRHPLSPLPMLRW